jgi:hypothetical protein
LYIYSGLLQALVENKCDWLVLAISVMIASTMLPDTRIVLFRPQLTQLQWTTERLCRLQLDLQNIPRLAFLRRCLAQLPAFIASLPLSQNDVLSRLETLAGLAGSG